MDYMSFDDLDDYSFLDIFDCLDVKSLIKILRVSKRWNILAYRILRLNRALSLSVDLPQSTYLTHTNAFQYREHERVHIPQLDVPTIIAIKDLFPKLSTLEICFMKVGGPEAKQLIKSFSRLKLLILLFVDESDLDTLLNVISKKCKYLEHIFIIGRSDTQTISATSFQRFVKKCRHLERIDIDTGCIPEEVITSLEVDSPTISSFTLHSGVYLDLPVIQSLQTDIGSNLTKFGFDCMFADAIDIVSRGMPNLISLDISLYCNFVTQEHIASISQLKDLEVLKMSVNLYDRTLFESFSDYSLARIFNKCPRLEFLQILTSELIIKDTTLSFDITNTLLLDMPFKCPNIWNLEIGPARLISDEGLGNLKFLKKLEVVQFSGANIGSKGANDLLTNCLEMRFLTLNYCKRVGNVAIRGAIKAAKLSKNPIVIFAKGTKMSTGKLRKNLPKNLKIYVRIN